MPFLVGAETAQPSPFIPYRLQPRRLHTREVPGSIPGAPTSFFGFVAVPLALIENSSTLSARLAAAQRMTNPATREAFSVAFTPIHAVIFSSPASNWASSFVYAAGTLVAGDARGTVYGFRLLKTH
jgi:hypothetical protein